MATEDEVYCALLQQEYMELTKSIQHVLPITKYLEIKVKNGQKFSSDLKTLQYRETDHQWRNIFQTLDNLIDFYFLMDADMRTYSTIIMNWLVLFLNEKNEYIRQRVLLERLNS